MLCQPIFKAVGLLILLNQPLTSYAQVEPPGFEGSGNPISSLDRIYTGDQASNTVTVIDPGRNKVLGTIALGDERLGNDLGPQYVSTANAHGLGFSRDGKYIVSLAVLSNTVTVIRTSDNQIVTKAYVDRGPHEAFFGPDNRTIWIGTRGVSSVNVIDAFTGELQTRIFTAAGPSKVLFNANGTRAYVNHIFDAVLSVVDVAARRTLYNITGLAAPFSSDMMISADGTALWTAHKMTGQVSCIDLAARKVVAILDTGTETNHPNFAVINGTNYGFVTVAALNATRVYRQPTAADVPVLVKTIPMTGIQPHGIWPSPDNTRMYVVNQHSDSVDVIDTRTLEIVDTMRVGQDGQALIYVSRVVQHPNDGVEVLGTQGLGLRVENRLVPVEEEVNGTATGNTSGPVNPYINNPQALVTVRQTNGLDMFEVLGRYLVPNASYVVSAVCQTCSEAQRMNLVHFIASQPSPKDCAFNEQVLAFLAFFEGYKLDSVKVKRDMTRSNLTLGYI